MKKNKNETDTRNEFWLAERLNLSGRKVPPARIRRGLLRTNKSETVRFSIDSEIVDILLSLYPSLHGLSRSQAIKAFLVKSAQQSVHPTGGRLGESK